MSGGDAEKVKRDIRARKGRIEGEPQYNDLEREAARVGRASNPRDIPAQDGTRNTISALSSGSFQPSTVETRGAYVLGPPRRPDIRHDAGFSNFPKEEPTFSDRLALIKWYAMIEGAEALRSDLTDGIAAYRHFHDGNGRAREFSYDRYVNNDQSGRTTFQNAVLEAQDATIKLYKEHGRSSFSWTGPAIPCGGDLLQYPYPATENWQKAIGGHTIWMSANVVVSSSQHTERFTVTLTIHAEDQYNFNPGQEDIATGAPDNANGRFVIVGWAHGYRHTATLRRTFAWSGYDLGVPSLAINPPNRARQPQNNRRARNRI